MNKQCLVGVTILSLCTTQLAMSSEKQATRVRMQTTMGIIEIELDHRKAPKTVENFLRYVKDGFYDGTLFHRVINDFMIQGGGYTPDYKKKPTRAPVINEARNGLKNTRGTIAMARTPDPHSATAQFFINVKDNNFLNYRSSTRQGWGYAVFGRVVNGMDVVDKIRKAPTGPGGPFRRDVPRSPIVIKKVTVIGQSKSPPPQQKPSKKNAGE